MPDSTAPLPSSPKPAGHDASHVGHAHMHDGHQACHGEHHTALAPAQAQAQANRHLRFLPARRNYPVGYSAALHPLAHPRQNLQ